MVFTVDYMPVISNMFKFFIQIKDASRQGGLETFIYHKLHYPKSVKIMVQDGDVCIPPQEANISSKGIHISAEIKNWISGKYVYSYVRYKNDVKLNYKKNNVSDLVTYIENGHKWSSKTQYSPKTTPLEILKISYDDEQSVFILEPYHCITVENADEFLDTEDYKIMMQYLFTNINSLRMAPSESDVEKLGTHISFFANNGASKWMSAEEYSKCDVMNMGMYNLRKKMPDGSYRYYTGKALKISERVVATKHSDGHYTVGHLNEEQFDEIRYDIFDFRQLEKTFKLYESKNSDASENECLKNYTSLADSVLYGIEGVVNHTVRMILDAENSISTNSAFDHATASTNS